MNYITPAALSALNSSVQVVENSDNAARAAEAVIERLVKARDVIGLEDHVLFQAIARGAGKKSGLHWLARLNGTLTEYLTAWGALVLAGVCFVAGLVLIKQNARAIWSRVSDFVKNNPIATGVMALGVTGAAATMFKDGEEDNAVDLISEVVVSALPLPVRMLVNGVSASISAPARSSVPVKSVGSELTAAQALAGDEYDARDAYDARDEYDEFSGNIG